MYQNKKELKNREDDSMKKYVKLLPLFVLTFTVGFAGHSLMTVGAEEEDVIPNTVYIGDIDVSGMKQNGKFSIMSIPCRIKCLR